MSKISQQVFVHGPPPKAKKVAAAAEKDSAAAPAPTLLKKTARPSPAAQRRQRPPAQVPDDFQGELKEKCMTFFSSVTRTKAEIEGSNTKL